MAWLDRILFATDFGRAALHARNDAARLARAYDASVDVVYVDPVRPDRDLPRIDRERIESLLARERESLHGAGSRTREVQFGRGSAAEVVLHVADGMRSDLIVIGAGDRSLREVTTGATAETVARFARQPVFISRSQPNDELSRILVGVDVSEASRAALRLGSDLAHRFQAKLLVGHVFEPGEDCPDAEAHAFAELDRFLESCDFLADLSVERVRRHGRPSDELRSAADETGASLVVLGRTSGALRRVYLGATSERLLRSSPCSLLLTSPAVELK